MTWRPGKTHSDSPFLRLTCPSYRICPGRQRPLRDDIGPKGTRNRCLHSRSRAVFRPLARAPSDPHPPPQLGHVCVVDALCKRWQIANEMEAQSAAGFGPVLFIGLTFAALVTHTPPNPDLPNPQDSTDFDAHPQIVSATVPVIEVPALALEQQIARLDSTPTPVALEADARVATRPPPKAIEVASYPDMPDQFLGFEAATPEVPSIATQIWTTTKGAAEPSVARVSAVEIAPIADTQPAPVNAAHAMRVPPLPAHPETAVASFDGWPEFVWDRPQSQLIVLQTEDAPDTSTDGWATVTGNFVNMRRDPGLTGARIDQYFRGNRLIVTRVDDGWARVNEPSNPPQTGWMSVEYLELDLR